MPPGGDQTRPDRGIRNPKQHWSVWTQPITLGRAIHPTWRNPLNRTFLHAAVLGALICFPALAAPTPSPEAKLAKAKITHIMTIKVTGMS